MSNMTEGKKPVYDLLVRMPTKEQAKKQADYFYSQLTGNLDFAECRIGIFYGGGKTVRVIEYEGSRTHLNVYKTFDSYILKTTKDAETPQAM